ncbi:MAG: hypothetical protein JXR25_17055 [Pontiellaceae bacterium]|nr:hypothetical protein [Pontiellaceae bacterium]MBN2786529.1 hypothetical protein [Pontiellaceae bacterium]
MELNKICTARLAAGLVRICLITFVCCRGTSSLAEMRIWTLNDGKTLEAEYVRDLFDKIVLRDADGKEHSLLKDSLNLSEDDIEYLELENPPILDLSFKKSIEQKNFSMIRYAEDRPPEWRANFGAKVAQKSSGDYNHPLTVEFFAIGQEIKGNRYILLDRNYSTFFLNKENKRKFEFYSKRTVRMTDLWDANDDYSRRGEQYFGFLIVVKDKRNKVIAMDASNKWLEENLENLEKRGIWNYMDKSCVRTFPTRPTSYIANREAGRN